MTNNRMTTNTVMPRRSAIHLMQAGAGLACLLMTTCHPVPFADIMVNESRHGAVYLERVPDSKFEAAHPIKLDREVIARTLRGIYVRTENGASRTSLASEQPIARAYSDVDVEYLTPHIVSALNQAVSDQRVGFRIVHPAPLLSRNKQGGSTNGSSDPVSGSVNETTEGNLYAFGTSLNVTLTKYRYRPEAPDTLNLQDRKLPDDTGPKLTDVLFYPADVRRPETYQPNKLLGEPLKTTLVIDYQLLAKLPASMLTPPQAKRPEEQKPTPTTGAVPPPPAARENSARQQNSHNELEALKKDMQKLRRQMEQQQEELERLKNAPKDKKGDVTPSP